MRTNARKYASTPRSLAPAIFDLSFTGWTPFSMPLSIVCGIRTVANAVHGRVLRCKRFWSTKEACSTFFRQMRHVTYLL